MNKKSTKHELQSAAYKARSRQAENEINKRFVMDRLDQSLPLITDDWQRVEQLLNLITEFAPTEMVLELSGAIAGFADDQARRGYLLGQDDIVKELKQRVA
ncbi:MAG: hypothetical protein SGJ27_13910 [Candidatus Melainabacteria bacterium]|nr:hypothetical protein [Candidatus Melainabacteria bacterium]